jgi:ubiquinone biosynthesis protein UbiJ
LKPIEVDDLRRLADLTGMDQMLVIAWCRATGRVHTLTWGRNAQDKHHAAILGDKVPGVLGLDPLSLKEEEIDYRFEEPGKLREEIDRLKRRIEELEDVTDGGTVVAEGGDL